MILVLITSKGVVRKALIPPLQTIHTFRGNKVIFMMIMMMGVRIIPLYCWCLIIFEERIHPIKTHLIDPLIAAIKGREREGKETAKI